MQDQFEELDQFASVHEVESLIAELWEIKDNAKKFNEVTNEHIRSLIEKDQWNQ